MEQKRKIQPGNISCSGGSLGNIATPTPRIVEEGAHPRYQPERLIIDSYDSDNDDEMQHIFEMQKQQKNLHNAEGDTAVAMKITTQLRRTPGANTMHRSAFEQLKDQSSSMRQGQQVNQLRRTPGASAMHRSSRQFSDDAQILLQEEQDKKMHDNRSKNTSANVSNAIDFGLPLSTPVARSQNKFITRNSIGKKSLSSQSDFNSSTPRFQTSSMMGPASKLKPPLPKKDGKNIYTPAGVALARNQNLNLRTPGSFSPNTFQLATALDDLLDEEEDDSLNNEMSPTRGFGSVINSSNNESILALKKTSSFGAESNVSGVTSCFSCDSIDIDSFTLDTSKDLQQNRSLVLSTEKKSNTDNSSRLHSSYVHNQFRTLDASYNSDVSINSGNKNKNTMNLLPSDSSPFSSPQKSPNHDTSTSILHVPTPQRAFQASPNPSRAIQQRPVEEENNVGLDNIKSHVQNTQHFHHHNTNPPQYMNSYLYQHPVAYNLGYDSNVNTYQHQLHPHPHPPIHHTLPFGYLHHLNHMPHHHSISPINLPLSMSPLTLPTFPTDLRHDAASPVPFINHQPNSGWNGKGNNWSNIGNTWDPHHSQNKQQYDFSKTPFYGREMNLVHAVSPTPLQMQHPQFHVPNQQRPGTEYHRSDEHMYHLHQPVHPIISGRNLEQFQHCTKQKVKIKKKRGNKFERDINLKENKKIIQNLQKDEDSDKQSRQETGKGTKIKPTTKLGKNEEIVHSTAFKNSQLNKTISSDVRSRRKKQSPIKYRSIESKGDHKNELTPEELVAEERKSELIETPAIRALFKEFYREFRVKEKISLDAAAKFARECLEKEEFPSSVHWRIYLELAEIAKRANKFRQSRKLFSLVCSLQPFASQGWLEYSKLEEECGNLTLCSHILNKGLHYCENNEQLLIRAIKHEEKLAQEEGHNDMSRARALLAPLKEISVEKVWKVMLEGALMEARAGCIVEARNILQYLMYYIPWYGPLYLEAFRLERDCEKPLSALEIVERGLKEIPRYGPLWFGAFRLCEGLDLRNNEFHLPRTLEMIDRSISCISRELVWKVHLEAAQALERAAHLWVEKEKNLSLAHALSGSRKRFVMTISTCPVNLRWKVYLASGRMELSAGRFDEARSIFMKSYSVVPERGRPTVLLECARLEEFVDETKVAKAILTKCRLTECADWKVWLQSVELAIRCGDRVDAIRLATKGLKEYSGTGRLWAVLVQLREEDGEKAQRTVLKQALYEVPKSGEVWCEGARIFLNPLSIQYDLDTARRHLEFATKFTPQFGDSFIETLRLELVQKALIPMYQFLLDEIKSKLEKLIEERENNEHCGNDYNNHKKKEIHSCYDEQFVNCYIKTLSECIQNAACTIQTSLSSTSTTTSMFDSVDTSKLELSCSNADPNYGKLWFHCRARPSDSARAVMKKAKDIIGHNLGRYGYFYVISFMRCIAIEMMVQYSFLYESDGKKEAGDDDKKKKGEKEMKILRDKWMGLIPDLKSLLLHGGVCMTNKHDDDNNKEGVQQQQQQHDNNIATKEKDKILLLESNNTISNIDINNICSSNFTTGIFEMNGNVNLQCLPLMERRKILFGSDLLL